MAESTVSSKAAKKNKKRRGKQSGEQSGDVEPIQNLRDQLAEAKANKDHTLANELRQKLWITQDLNAGFKPVIDKDDHNAKKLLNKVTDVGLGKSETTTVPATAPITNVIEQDEKKMHNLQKKLKNIEELKRKKEAGEKLQDNQLKKIEREAKVMEEIEHLQKLMKIPVKT